MVAWCPVLIQIWDGRGTRRLASIKIKPCLVENSTTRRGAFPEPNPLFRAQGRSGNFPFLGRKGQRRPFLSFRVPFPYSGPGAITAASRKRRVQAARIVLPGDCPPVESSQCQSGMRYCQWEAWQLTFRPRAVGMGMGMGRAVGTCDGLLGKVDAGKVERR